MCVQAKHFLKLLGLSKVILPFHTAPSCVCQSLWLRVLADTRCGWTLDYSSPSKRALLVRYGFTCVFLQVKCNLNICYWASFSVRPCNTRAFLSHSTIALFISEISTWDTSLFPGMWIVNKFSVFCLFFSLTPFKSRQFHFWRNSTYLFSYISHISGITYFFASSKS